MYWPDGRGQLIKLTRRLKWHVRMKNRVVFLGLTSIKGVVLWASGSGVRRRR